MLPFWGFSLGFYKVIPKRNYLGAYGLHIGLRVLGLEVCDGRSVCCIGFRLRRRVRVRFGFGLEVRATVGKTLNPKPQHPTYSLHCSSFFWFNQYYIKDPIR